MSTMILFVLAFGYDYIQTHTDKGNANSHFGRLQALVAGLILIAVGILRMLGGVQVVTH
jgi:hypothetical protein